MFLLTADMWRKQTGGNLSATVIHVKFSGCHLHECCLIFGYNLLYSVAITVPRLLIRFCGNVWWNDTGRIYSTSTSLLIVVWTEPCPPRAKEAACVTERNKGTFVHSSRKAPFRFHFDRSSPFWRRYGYIPDLTDEEMAAESNRRFTKNLLKPGSAAEIRQTACNAIRNSTITVRLVIMTCAYRWSDVWLILSHFIACSTWPSTLH